MPWPGCHWLKTASSRSISPHGDAGVERFGDPVGELGNAERMRRHGACPAGGNAPFGGDRAAPRADQEQLGRGEVGADRIEHALAEGAGKSLLGAEQHERRPGRFERAVWSDLAGTSARARPMAAAIVAA